MAAVELANAYITIVPSLRGATKQITSQLGGVDTSAAGSKLGEQLSNSIGKALNVQTISAGFKNVGARLDQVGSSLTRGVTAPAVVAGGAVGGLVAAFGWGRLKSIDSAQAQLKGLGYSAEDVERISGQLVKALDGGMLTMGEATSAAAAGMAAGVSEGKELTRYIQLLDAATAGSNGTFDEMNQIFARVQGSGKLMTAELDMVEQRMPGFSGAAAKAFGVTQAELREMVSAGEVSSEEFLNVMDGFAGGMATEYAKSWDGMVQNTKAYVGIVGQTMLGGVFEQSKGAVGEFIEYLKSDDVAAWAQKTGEMIGETFTKILSGVKSVISWWVSLDASQQKMIGSLAGMAIAAGPVLKVIGKISTTVGTVIRGVSALGRGIGATIGGLVKFGGAVRSGAQTLQIIGMYAWDYVRAGARVVATTVAQSAAWVAQKTALIATTVATKAATIAQKALNLAMRMNPIGLIVTAITALVGALVWFFTKTEIGQEIWAAFTQFLREAWANVSQFFIDTWNNIVSFFTTSGDAIASWWNGLWQGISNFFSAVWDGIVAFVKGYIKGLTLAVTIPIRALAVLWRAIWTGVKTAFSTVWNAIVGFAKNYITRVKATIVNTVNAVKTVWNATWTGIKTFFTNVWNTIVSAAKTFGGAVKTAFTNVVDFVKSIPKRVMDFFAGIGTWLLDSGKALIQGFLDGITAGFNKAKQWVSDGLGAIRNLFPFSPAKEGPFSGRGWVAYSGLSLGQTFTQSVAASLHDGRKDVEDELGGIQDRFDQFDGSTSFRVGSAVPAFAATNGTGGARVQVDVHGAPGMDEATVGTIAAHKISNVLRRV